MEWWIWALIIIAALVVITAIVFFCVSIYFFRFTILRKPTATLDKNINANTDWHKHIPFIEERKKWLEKQNLQKVSVTSDDGLKLSATLIKNENNSNKVVICFHGYTADGMTNYGAMSKFLYEQGFNVLLVDQRAHGQSEGKYIGFGVLDRYDAVKWIDFAINTFGKDCKIFLHGTSMGASTVLMTSGLELPQNVKGIIADCGFTSAFNVFSHILKRDYHLPKFPLMNLTEMWTKKFAGYGYNDVCTLDEVKKTKIPILFIHGDKDDFVPTYMSEQNYEACKSDKQILIVKGADHAESYYVGTEAYEAAAKQLFEKYGSDCTKATD